jgi:hypothetical protein
MDGKNGITGSKMAFQEFMDMQRDEKTFTLTVSNF